jgi:Pyruvate/2-oxoacid:ferredoxin oxidoreductase gamma subunit
MTMEEFKWLAQFGLGAVMAGAMFWAYRADRKASEDRYALLANEFREIVQENTKVITKLSDALSGARGASWNPSGRH